MPKKKKIHIGTIHPDDVKVRKKPAPPTRVQKSVKEYDRKRLKEQDQKELDDE
jgi:hypothetical protein